MPSEEFRADQETVPYFLKSCVFCHGTGLCKSCHGEGYIGHGAEICRRCQGQGLCEQCRGPIEAIRFTINRTVNAMDEELVIILDTVDLLSDGGFVWTLTFSNQTSLDKPCTLQHTYVVDEFGNRYRRIDKQDNKLVRAGTQEKTRIEFSPLNMKATTLTLHGLSKLPYTVKLVRP